MLFNSPVFIGVFLPLTFVGFVFALRISGAVATIWLLLASFVFYGYWRADNLIVMSVSIVCNYLAGAVVIRMRERQYSTTPILAFAISANLIAIAYYKYYNFLGGPISLIGAVQVAPATIVLPLGISFFTFTQIAYLVDASKGLVKDRSFSNYALFVSYFPHLIAGPILHHAEMIPQFRSEVYEVRAERIAVGLTIFVLGLSKKVILADNVAPYANATFENPGVPALEAWAGVLAYALQIYFDFSGYSDMAIGLSYLFGVKLPINFNSPYKATNIIDFWRRWHITLSRFLRDYLYIPLGGNRRGILRRHINLLLTMALGGLWHGAAWTFVIWGSLHGIYLVTNHLWRAFVSGNDASWPAVTGRIIGFPVTFIAITLAWVFFRASSLKNAVDILASMFGRHGLMPAGWREYIVMIANPNHWDSLLQPSWAAPMVIVPLLLIICWLFPNTQEIMSNYQAWLGERYPGRWLRWRPATQHAIWVASLGGIALIMLQRENSPFLYFQF
jgi:alginate O-acetyltransferase complex protein AlgI